MMPVGEIIIVRKGTECDIKWKIHFAFLSEIDNFCFSSPNFSFEDESWWLQMWTSSSNSATSDAYICLRLYKDFALNRPINVELTFSFKTVNDYKDLGRKITKDFLGNSWSDTVQLLSKSDFVKRQSEFLASEFLTVVCTIKRLNFTGSSNDGATAECSYSKRSLDTDSISSSKKKCLNQSIKCPECLTVIDLQNCQTASVKDDNSLYEDFKEMLLNGINHDLILKVGDMELKAHRDVLRTRSQVFKSMLSHDTKERHSGIVDIPDCDPQAMEQFLCYIYSGQVDTLEESNMLNLYYIADKYDVKELKRKCCAFIKSSLSKSNICEVILLALNHSDSSLLEHATEYFMDNALEIMCTVEWQSFMKDNCTVANELTIKSFKKLNNANN